VRIVKTINRYIFSESLSYFLVSLFAFTALILVARILRFTNLIVNKGVQIEQIGMVFLAVIPTFLEIALPMSALLGVLMAFGRLSADSEIVVLRASGVSLTQMIKPVFVFAILCTILCFGITSELRPWGYRQLSQTLFEIARSKSTAGLEAGMFNKLGEIILYADSVNHQTGALSHALIDDKRDPERRQIIFAQSGTILSDEKARTITMELYDGIIHEEYRGRYNLTKFTTNRLSLDPDEIYNPDAKKKSSKLYREMGSAELTEYITSLQTKLIEISEVEEKDEATLLEFEELKKTFLRSKIEDGRRVSMPFAAFLLALIAMPLGIQPPRMQRAWGASLSIAIAMIVFILYYAFISIGVALAESGSIHPLIALWMPNLVIAVFTFYLLKQMGSERWQSIAEGVEGLLLPVTKKVMRKVRKEVR
jgi:lipopolysaccharide export system permease protein